MKLSEINRNYFLSYVGGGNGTPVYTMIKLDTKNKIDAIKIASQYFEKQKNPHIEGGECSGVYFAHGA